GVAITRNGTSLASGCADGTVRLWAAATGAVVTTLAGHASRVTGVAIAPDGNWLATSSSDKTARLWDTAKVAAFANLSLDVLRSTTYLPVGMRSAAWSPDGLRLALAGGDGTVHVSDAKTGATLQSFTAH